MNLKDGLITPLVTHNFIYPNGIALNEMSGTLYIGDRTGITMVDLRNNNAASVLETQEPGYLNDIDGLYFYNNSLVGIQGVGKGNDRIVRFYLNNSGRKVQRLQVLKSYQPEDFSPTTGTIVNNEFYYIVNSQLENLQADGTITNVDQLKKTMIKKIKLNPIPRLTE